MLWLIPVILAEYFEIWIIELNLNGYCLNCSESQSLNNINKGNGDKVSSVGIIVCHVEAA